MFNKQRKNLSTTINIFYINSKIISRYYICKYYCLALLFFNKFFQYIEQTHNSKCCIKYKYIKIFSVDKFVISLNQIIDKFEFTKLNAKAIIDTNLVFFLIILFVLLYYYFARIYLTKFILYYIYKY